jgi:hypothetical protein
MFSAAEQSRPQGVAHRWVLFPYVASNRISKTIGRDHKHLRKDARERRTGPFVSSSLRTLFLGRNLQPVPFQALPNSLARNKNVTIAFSVGSALFARSFAKERKSTPLFSSISALFL